jgi:hypothetical protein
LIVLEFTGQDMPVKFTFRKRKHFYGFISPHYDSAQEGFKFELLEELIVSTEKMLNDLKEEEKNKVIPPPPVFETVEVEESNTNQLNIIV